MTPIREQLVREALAVSELRAAIPETKGAFRALLGPAQRGGQWDLDRPFRCWRDAQGRYHTEGTSTCGLVAAGLLSRVLALPWAGYPYWEYPAPYSRLDIVSAFSLLGIELARLPSTFRNDSPERHGTLSQVTPSSTPAGHPYRSPGAGPVRLPKGQPPQPGDVCCIGSGLATHVLTVVDYDGRIVTSVDGGQVDDSQHRYLQRVKVCRRQWSGMRVVWVLDLDRLAESLPVIPWGSPDWESTLAGKQWGLKQQGYDPGPIDGIMGPKTRAALAAAEES